MAFYVHLTLPIHFPRLCPFCASNPTAVRVTKAERRVKAISLVTVLVGHVSVDVRHFEVPACESCGRLLRWGGKAGVAALLVPPLVATVGAVVSKPTAKNTTCRSGWRRARSTASSGE